MKKIVLFFAVWIFACGTIVQGADHADHDVLVHASSDACWFARVSKVSPFLAVDSVGPQFQTEVFVRQNGPGQPWRPLPVLPGRVTALATRSSQLAVLMSGGKWMTLFAEGSANGQPLPAGGLLKTIADDGSDLWAIGSVDGGIAAANDSIARDPATRPTTGPYQAVVATTGPFESATSRASGPRLVIFREQNGRWATVTELPAEITPPVSENELSMVVLAAKPMVAFRSTEGKIHIVRYVEKTHWEQVTTIAPSTQPTQSFGLFSDGYDPYFWQTSGNSPGEMYVNVSGKSPRLPLDWGNNTPLDGIPAATFSGGFVSVFGPHADKILEQRYERSGKPFETAASLIVHAESADRFIPPWLEIAFLCMMAFSVGASVFQQWNQPEKHATTTTLAPAELLPRFAAGMIDLLPVIASIAVLLTVTSALDDLAETPSLKGISILAAGVFVYLLHTTLSELRIGRTIGKWLMGLRVVTVDGKTPDSSQFLIRNLLRVVDPLIMILVSPLRQRSADTVSGTMVIEDETQALMDPISDEPETENVDPQ